MSATTETFGSIGGFNSLLDDSFIFDRLTKKQYPQFVTKTIRLLSQNSGLHIKFANSADGSHFNFETKTVCIPAPPAFELGEDKFKKELRRWRGLVNHEVGHAMFTLWHTKKNQKIVDQENRLYPMDHHMFNDLFENGRMERVACDKFPGMIGDLQSLEEFLTEIIRDYYKQNPANFNHIYYALRMLVNGYKPAVEIPEHLREDWEIVKKMAEEAWDTNDEEKTYAIARKVEKYLKKRQKEEEKKRKEGKDKEKELKDKLEKMKDLKEKIENGEIDPNDLEEADENTPDEDKIDLDIELPKGKKSKKGKKEKSEKESDEGESNEGEDKGEEKDKPANGKKQSKSEKEGDKEKQEGAGEQEEGDEEGDEQEGEEGDKEGDEEEGDELSEEEKAEKEAEQRKQEALDALEEELEQAKKELKETIEKNIKMEKEAEEKDAMDPENAKEVDPTEVYKKEHKGDISTVKRGGEVVPLPLWDYVQNINVEVKEHSAQTQKLLNDVMGHVAGMAQRFIQKVRSRVHVGVRTYEGRINRRKLHRYRIDKNIFKTQNLRQKKDAAVMIIVDCSGSMNGGGKIETARKAALVLGEMMFRAGVEFEIKGFTIGGFEYTFSCFTRHADLIHYRFGGSKDWNHTKHCVLDGKLSEGLMDNDDGESLRQFAAEIATSRKDRKMMVVISDGIPCANVQFGNVRQDLKDVIQEIRSTGTEVYAVGLNTNVEQFYGRDSSVRLSSHASTEELVQALSKFVGLISVG